MKKNIMLALSLAVLTFIPLAVSHADEDMGQKLNQILENQQQIKDSLEQIKSELQIIKVRATR